MKYQLAAATAVAVTALTLGAAPAIADSSGDIINAGSSAIGSSSKKQPHYGKLGRSNAPNGVRSINTWVYAPNARAGSDGAYAKGSKIGVKWNSTIESGEEVGGSECSMTVKLTGPKVPAKAGTYKTKNCTSRKTFTLRTAGDYTIRVTDAVSGASNAIKFSVR